MKVFVINLPEATERKEGIIKELNKTDLDYEFVVPEESDEEIDPIQGWTNGANSLRLTTIKLVRQALEEGLDNIWIWEDDCIIDKSEFGNMMDYLPTMLLEDFDFIHLNHSGGFRFSLLTKFKVFRRTIDGVRNCQSYIINKGVYKEYLKVLENKTPIDEMTKLLHQRRKRSYVVDTRPVDHKVGKYSYIRNMVVDY